MPELSETQGDVLTVVSWNILLDYTRSKHTVESPQLIAHQKDRVPGQIETLRQLGVPLDIVSLQEVEGGHGERIATALGYDKGTWFNHNTSRRRNEHIGMFGARVSDVESVETRHDKVAVLTRVGRLAVLGVHNRHEIIGPMRTQQTADFLAALCTEESAVIMGDINAVGWQRPHALIRKAGFESVFALLNQPEPKTHPVESYRSIFYSGVKSLVIPRGTASDRIYVKGCNVLDAGVFESDTSDHRGVWATIKTAQ